MTEKTLWDKNQKELEIMMDSITEHLHGKSLGIVIPALATLIGQAGVDSNVEQDWLNALVVHVIDTVYKEGPVEPTEKIQ